MLNYALKTLRQFEGITQTELAQQLNVSVSHISEIETGKNTITLEMLNKYANYFDVPVSHLMLFAEQIENESLRSEKVRKFIAKNLLKVMDWVIKKDEKEKTHHSQ
ncbi:helix-turn-helix domain-containing protein [Glaesserella parasuis]|uniref:Helix-turn-helix transcriptional regulator n=1 Tax=Glaesserella parasuis TaxID=738 RepID=A0AAJ6AEU6_GLAPU|nr:helix-turn-helix transcriptional regulator [Glaesserella parasuis]MCT8609300.1 helix-turn-helix transcriptional regulator [Glaesserella parasuis]MCT8655866.1 helix-turn-helix transcriptional regulator [Glaesserella parasuis]MCT8823520.1 helix-turn-helix transcriptional regulator [Glaesserella parasuis]MDE4003029.1 helix-turn-helix transcriptional regulator [Glaesserella parasuis]MDE4022850.1 helix-turn-helix transcriptional regulator [Glaesserella parasuis]